MNRRLLMIFTTLAMSAALLFTAGCSNNPDELEDYPLDYEGIVTDVSILPTIKIAALESDDMLPFLVAKSERQTEFRGLDLQIFYFDSVDLQRGAFISGEFDAIMTDMADIALFSAEGIDVRAVAVITDPYEELGRVNDRDVHDGEPDPDTALLSHEATMSMHQQLFDLPKDLTPQRVLAFSYDFLIGNVAVGDATTPERSAEAIGTLTGILTNCVERINSTEDEYKRLFLEQGPVAGLIYDEPSIPHYPQPVLPDQVRSEDLLLWLYEHGHIPEPLNYNDLVFVPNAP